MSLKNPKVTILLATYNRAHLIGESLDSILNQTYKNWECLIVDDGSVDDTKEILKPYLLKDSRFNYYERTKNYKKGLSGTRNYGLDLAQEINAQYIQFFDDDDIMHPRKLELQIKPFLTDESLGFTTCKYKHYYGKEVLKFELKDEVCNISTKHLFEDFFSRKVNINSLGPIWRSNLIFKYRFDEDLIYSEERDLYLKLFLLEKPKFKNIDFVLFYYRKHLVSNTSNRYEGNLKKTARYKSDLNFYTFLKINDLWNYFLIREMIKKFVFYNFDNAIYSELLNVINKDKNNLGFKLKLLKGILIVFIAFRINFIKLVNKL